MKFYVSFSFSYVPMCFQNGLFILLFILVSNHKLLIIITVE